MKLLKDWLSPDTQYEFSYLDTLFAVHPQWDNVILSLEGKDAKRFLQGQCTCNLDEVTKEHSNFAATCTPKGRMFALFKIARLTEEHYLIKLPSELAADFQNRLSKYLAFFKAEIKASSWFALGLTIPEACAEATPELPTEFGATIQVDNNQLIIRHPTQTPIWELWLNSASDAADNFVACQSSEATSISDQPTPVADWNQLEVQNGIPEVVTATQEEYIPQMMNLQAIDGISFKKGCYTGQEIVARMQYLGKLKKRMYRFEISAPSTIPAIGDALYDKDDNKVGNIVRIATRVPAKHNSYELLAVIQNEKADQDLFSATGQTNLLSRKTMHYEPIK